MGTEHSGGRIAAVVFGLTAALLVTVLLAVFVVEERPVLQLPGGPDSDAPPRTVRAGHGMPHHSFETMLQGGDGTARHAHLLWLGWVYGVLQTLLFAACMALGLQRRGRLGPYAVPMAICAALYALVYSALLLSYRRFMNEGEPGLFLFHPHPTALMLTGMWWFPAVFILLFLYACDRWYLSDESMARFAEIMARKQAGEPPA